MAAAPAEREAGPGLGRRGVDPGPVRAVRRATCSIASARLLVNLRQLASDPGDDRADGRAVEYSAADALRAETDPARCCSARSWPSPTARSWPCCWPASWRSSSAWPSATAWARSCCLTGVTAAAILQLGPHPQPQQADLRRAVRRRRRRGPDHRPGRARQPADRRRPCWSWPPATACGPWPPGSSSPGCCRSSRSSSAC